MDLHIEPAVSPLWGTGILISNPAVFNLPDWTFWVPFCCRVLVPDHRR